MIGEYELTAGNTKYQRHIGVFNALNWEPFLSSVEHTDRRTHRGTPKGKRGTGAWRHCDTIRGPDDLHLYLAIKRPRDYSHRPARILLSPSSPLLSGRIVHGFPSSSRNDLILPRADGRQTMLEIAIIIL